jgi:tetratricopeptide (TPR) repeat protein
VSADDLAEDDRRAALEWIERHRLERIDRSLREARKIFDVARDPSRSTERGWFDDYLDRLVRLRSPDLVREILAPEHLDSPSQWEQRLAFRTLGRIGDTRTVGPEGRDVVEALQSRLETIDLNRESDVASALIAALGSLRDPRSYASLKARQSKLMQTDIFWQQIQTTLGRIPIPEELRRASELDPEGWEENDRLGRALHAKGQQEEACEAFTRAIRNAPMTSRGPIYAARGVARQALGDLEGARTDFTHAIDLNPRLTSAYSNRARVRKELGDLDGALADFDRAIEIDPQNAIIFNNRSDLQRRRNDLDSALADANRALEIEPDFTHALLSRSLAYKKKGEPQKSLADLQRTIALDPRMTSALYLRAEMKIGLGDLEGARIDLSRTIDVDPRHVRAHAAMAQIHLKRGDTKQAIEALEVVLGIEPRNVAAHFDLAQLHRKLGEHQRVIEFCERILEIDPDHIDAVGIRADAQWFLGDYDGALTDLVRLIESRPDDWLLYSNYSQALHKVGRTEEALESLKRSLHLAPAARRTQLQSRIDAIRKQLDDSQ